MNTTLLITCSRSPETLEMVINIMKEGGQDSIVVDRNCMFLHWGYSGSRHLLDPWLSEVSRRLNLFWNIHNM